MRTSAPCIFSLLTSFTALIAAVPASIPVNNVQSINPALSLLQPTGNAPHPLNVTLPGPYSHITGSGTSLRISWVWPVPDTDLTLFLDSFPNQPVEKASLLNTLAIMKQRVTFHLASHRDGWLVGSDDPLVEEVKTVANGEEWHVKFESNPWLGPWQRKQHLTYGIVLDVVETWMQLINGALGACHTFGSIMSSEWGHVGGLAATPPGFPR